MRPAYWLDLYDESLSATWWQEIHARTFRAMTETTASHPAFRSLNRAHAGARSVPQPSATRRVRIALPAWLPRSILQRGGIATRDDARALRDLEAARDRSDW
jgi:hypothetical protein